VIVLCAHEGLRLLRSRRVRLAAGAVVLGLAAMAALLVATARSHVGLGAAAQIRVQLTEVGLATARRYPVFGVGLGDYVRMSRRWIAPDMTALLHFASQGENAHNNYLQIVVELGIPAGLVFLAMVGRMAALGWSGWDDRRARSEMPTPELEGLALGFSAFLLSAVFGHPLLIPLVSATFFLALGLLAGLAPVPAPRGPNRALAIQAAVLFYAVSLVWRLR
jgi:O-antigen ligase